MSTYSIVLAGGSGTRLWPLSRKYYPKQFIQLEEMGGKSLYQKTLERAALVSRKENILVMTNKDYKFHCMMQSEQIGIRLSESQIIVEPKSKNTLPAITFAMKNIGEDDIGLILPSDHVIDEDEKFKDTIEMSIKQAKNSLVTFGVKPFEPHTGYGYISVEKVGDFPVKVKEFKEKPDKEKALEYIEKGYFWNAGIFLFSRKIFFSELEKHNKDFFSVFNKLDNNIEEIFDKVPDLSIDYGLLEHSDNIYLTPLDMYWSDLGSFDALNDYLKRIKYVNENIIENKSKDNFVLSEVKGKIVGMIGVDDLVVVDTKDALLISKKGETQKIRDIVNSLKASKSSGITDFGITVYRPWGSYTIIDEGLGFKTKRITVVPKKKLSYQMHYHRSEHWVVVTGTAIVTVGEKEMIIRKGESTYIPIGTKHRLENPGKTDLHIIESQIGDYLEEDDIVRFDDEFGRT